MTFTFDTVTGMLFVLPYMALLAICLSGMSAPQEWPTDEDGNVVRGNGPIKKSCPNHPGTPMCVCRKNMPKGKR